MDSHLIRRRRGILPTTPPRKLKSGLQKIGVKKIKSGINSPAQILVLAADCRRHGVVPAVLVNTKISLPNGDSLVISAPSITPFPRPPV